MNTNLVTTFKSHTTGKNADVSIYSDRIEWVQKRSVNWKLAIITCGLSLVTLLFPRQAATEMIPIKHVNSVTTSRKNLMWTTVRVMAPGNTIDFNVSHDEARGIASTLNSLILA